MTTPTKEVGEEGPLGGLRFQVTDTLCFHWKGEVQEVIRVKKDE